MGGPKSSPKSTGDYINRLGLAAVFKKKGKEGAPMSNGGLHSSGGPKSTMRSDAILEEAPKSGGGVQYEPSVAEPVLQEKVDDV
jgi:hypothetical protein